MGWKSFGTGFVGTYSSSVNSGTDTTYTYTYDQSGNITKIVYSTGEEIRYVYDDVGQLIREDNEPFDATYVFTYDDAGNILRRSECPLTAAGVTPVAYSYGIYDYEYEGDRLVGYWGNDNFEYDTMGNPTKYNSFTAFELEWDGPTLKSITEDIKYTFTYNESGLRTSKTDEYGNVTRYYYDGDLLLMEVRNNVTLYFLYDESGSPIGMRYRQNNAAEGVWENFWYEKNIFGDIVAIYNDSGVKVASYVYDAWGECYPTYHVSGTGAAYNPLLYRGYYFDSSLSLYYLQSRYYDCYTGRFISPDHTSYLGANGDLISYNLYAYCSNNPVMYTDPSGHLAISTLLIGFAISSLVGWGLTELFGAQIAGGVASISGGGNAILTGINLCAFGPWGIAAGCVLIAIGGITAAFGANEVVGGITGTNYIQSLTGMSDSTYNGIYIGLNIASALGSIAGNVGMRIASNNILNNIVKNPIASQNYKLSQLKVYGRYSSQYTSGTLRRGGHIGQGYTLTNTGGAPKGYIQWHPGSGHHYGGLPYLKVTSALGGTWRGQYLF